MLTATICEMYGWTWDEYHSQPAFFLEAIREKIVRDNKERELEVKKIKNGQPRY